MLTWPSISSTNLGFTFLEQRRVAQVCLRSYKRMGWGRPALLKRGLEGRPEGLWRGGGGRGAGGGGGGGARRVGGGLGGGGGGIGGGGGVAVVEVKTRPWSCPSPASFSRAHL